VLQQKDLLLIDLCAAHEGSDFLNRAVRGLYLGSAARGRKLVFDTLRYRHLSMEASFWVEQGRQSPRACYPCVTAQAGHPSPNTWLTKSKMHEKHGDNTEVQLNALQSGNGLQELGLTQQCGCRFPPSRMLNQHSSRARAWKAVPVAVPTLGHWVTVICCDQSGFLHKDDYNNAWVFVYPVAGGCN